MSEKSQRERAENWKYKYEQEKLAHEKTAIELNNALALIHAAQKAYILVNSLLTNPIDKIIL